MALRHTCMPQKQAATGSEVGSAAMQALHANQLLLLTLSKGNLGKLGVGPMHLNNTAFEEVIQETM